MLFCIRSKTAYCLSAVLEVFFSILACLVSEKTRVPSMFGKQYFSIVPGMFPHVIQTQVQIDIMQIADCHLRLSFKVFTKLGPLGIKNHRIYFERVQDSTLDSVQFGFRNIPDDMLI